MGEEHELRCRHFERELLARFGVKSIGELTVRELEQFRASGSIHREDRAWLSLLAHWKGLTGQNTAPEVSEIETWPDSVLYGLLCREAAPHVHEAAAVELYRRSSKFCASEEFAQFKEIAIDRELRERKAGHDPSRVLDALQRLNQKSEANAVRITDANHAQAQTTAEITELRERQDVATANSAKLESELSVRASSLQQAINSVEQSLKKKIKQLVIGLGSLTGVTVLAILSHIIWRV